jgi:pimeloyl-ACP methyl ester carboxylesterase
MEFFRRLNAPHKEIIWFQHSAHFPFLEEQGAFVSAMDRLAKETAANP